MKVPGDAAAAAWRARWQALAPRERRLVALAAALVAATLAWTVGIAPALRTLRAAPAERAALDAQLGQMRRLADEAARWRAVAPIAPEAAQPALAAAVARLGAGATLQMQGPQRAVVTFRGGAGPALAAFVAEARAGARARPIDVQWGAAAGAPGTWDGSMTLAVGGEAP